MTYRLPDLPDGQRWKVTRELCFTRLFLQERRRRWGWRTIASSIMYSDEGYSGWSRMLYMIENRDYFERRRVEREAERRERRAQVPYGTH